LIGDNLGMNSTLAEPAEGPAAFVFLVLFPLIYLDSRIEDPIVNKNFVYDYNFFTQPPGPGRE
jgi:hypothetical protein